MNAERLLAHYEKIADAPNAVVRLRRFVLDLAVRGKLVPQDASDEPASELLKRIAAEKARLVKAGEIRNKPELPAVAEDDAPFDLPRTWKWVRLANVIDFSAGRTPSRHDPSFWNTGDHAWASIADMEDGQVLGTTKETVSNRARDKVFGSQPEAPGTLIMSFKLTIGKIARLGIPAFHNEAIIAIRPHLPDLDPYLFKVLPQFARRADPKGAVKGATLNRESISNILLPLPPLAEQHRIVAKVDELMGLCDRLEAARQRREAARDRLSAASLARLNAPDPETFEADARFALDALPALTARADQIKHLRKTVLNLAMRGKLVPQNPKDQPASELLKRIAKKRAELLKAGYPNPDEARTQIKKLAEQSVPDGLEALPRGWAWATLLQCSALVIDCKNKTAPYASSGIRLIRTTNVRDGRMNLNDQKYVDQKTYEIWSARCTPEPGDILITREAPMGEVCLIPPGEEICLGQRMMLARLVPDTIDRNFMIYSLRDPNRARRRAASRCARPRGARYAGAAGSWCVRSGSGGHSALSLCSPR